MININIQATFFFIHSMKPRMVWKANQSNSIRLKWWHEGRCRLRCSLSLTDLATLIFVLLFGSSDWAVHLRWSRPSQRRWTGSVWLDQARSKDLMTLDEVKSFLNLSSLLQEDFPNPQPRESNSIIMTATPLLSWIMVEWWFFPYPRFNSTQTRVETGALFTYSGTDLKTWYRHAVLSGSN